MAFMTPTIRFALLFGAAAFAAPSLPGAGPPADDELRALMPPPSWLMKRGKELGIDSSAGRLMRTRWQEAQGELTELKRDARFRKRELRSSLSQEPFDRASVEARFEELLEAELKMKRTALKMRLDALETMSSDQRARVRSAVSEEMQLRTRLRSQIEMIRRRGKRLYRNGADTSSIQSRVREIEQLIRAGELVQADLLASQLVDELH